MNVFKDLIRQDNSKVFMNQDEFGEVHEINGRSICIMIDNIEMIEREARLKQPYRDGIFKKQVLFYVQAHDFGHLPATGSYLELDRGRYIVTDAVNEDGIYSISLEANRSC